MQIDVLKSVIPNAPTMKFIIALSFIFIGISIYCIARMRDGDEGLPKIILPSFALIVLISMIFLIISSITGLNMGIERIFVQEAKNPIFTVVPGRPTVATMINFILISIAVTLSQLNFEANKKIIYKIGVAVSVIGSVPIIGYIINQPILLYYIPNVSTGIAIHAAVLTVIAGIAFMLIGASKESHPSKIRSMKIKTRLVSLFVITSAIPVFFVGMLSYTIAKDFEALSTIGNNFLIIGLITVTFVGIYSYFIVKSVISPILKLKNTTDSISKGNLTVKADEDTSDEIGELGKSFNAMIEGIKQKIYLENESRKLQQIDKDKEEFAAMISHELKTPLIPISGYAELFLDGSLGNITDLQREKMQVMYENSIRLTTLIQDILDARKIELKRLNLDIRIESIKEITKRCIDVFQPIAEPKGIRLIDETQDITIRCDPDRILQVLNNIVSNAMKFVPAQDGTILINSRNDKDTVMMSIKDNGIGIPKSKQEDLFKKFYQVDKSLTRKSGGTGLGLAISRGIIEAHGGKIWVESEENQGTTIHFTMQKGNDK